MIKIFYGRERLCVPESADDHFVVSGKVNLISF